MRYSFSLALWLAMLAPVVVLPEQHARIAHAAQAVHGPSTLVAAFNPQRAAAQTPKTGAAHKTSGEAGSAAPVVREVDLEALKKLLEREPGKAARPLLVNFWATWCEPCREEFPDLIKINADYGQSKLEIITISLDDPAEIKTTVPKFLREMRAGDVPSYLLNVIDPDTVIVTVDPQWHGGLPATFLYDASGKMVFKHTGRFNTGELRAAIDQVTSGK
jgi:thiol-disulfide isomerase/thioredoxin